MPDSFDLSADLGPFDVVPPESELGALWRCIRETQAYGAERLAASGLTFDDIPALVERSMSDPDPAAVEAAKRLVADLALQWPGPPARIPSDEDDRIGEVWAEVLAEELEANRRKPRGERV